MLCDVCRSEVDPDGSGELSLSGNFPRVNNGLLQVLADSEHPATFSPEATVIHA